VQIGASITFAIGRMSPRSEPASCPPGGIFSPSLAVGAGLSADIAQLFPSAPIEPIICLRIVAYFAGVVQASPLS
jgi:H+/Cl- antiporter ClcA